MNQDNSLHVVGMWRRLRSFLLLTLLLAAGTLAPSLLAEPRGIADAETPPIYLLDVFPGLRFTQPLIITHAGDARLFIVEQPGRIWVVEGRGSAARKSLFLDISERVQDGCERGLLGLAFHPNYAQNGYFYVNYIARYGLEGEEKDYTRIARFQVTADPAVADPQSELQLMEIEQLACNHNGGDLHFDPSGMLITGLGDGGGAGDPEQNAQDPQSYLGKLLRLDVDSSEGGKNYGIPGDNPFVGQDPLDEIWALGLRNPWRFSYDRLTGDLYIGDVGQSAWEEINFVPAAQTGGQNYEWSLREGLVAFNPTQPSGPGIMTAPIYVYEHASPNRGYSVTGGYVYRGTMLGDLQGVYVYADFDGGDIHGLWREAGQARTLGALDDRIVTFGEDNQGELYLAAYNEGAIYGLHAAANVALLPVLVAP